MVSGSTSSATNDSIGSSASTRSLTSVRAVIRASPSTAAVMASAEFMNVSSSCASSACSLAGLTARTLPPDMLTKSCPPTPAPGSAAGISAQPTASSRFSMGAVPPSGLTTLRQK